MTQAEVSAVEQRIEAVERKLVGRIEGVEDKLAERFDQGLQRVFDKVDAISAREDTCRLAFAERLAAIETTGKIHSKGIWWVLGIGGAAASAGLGGIGTLVFRTYMGW